MGSVGALGRGWRDSNFGMGYLGRVDPQHFSEGQKMTDIEILLSVKHMILRTFFMILRSLTCESSLFFVFSPHTFL